MFSSNPLEVKLVKINNVFTKALDQYRKVVESADTEIEVSAVIIDNASMKIEESKNIKARAKKAIAGIESIIGV